jgi:hypothetical protein
MTTRVTRVKDKTSKSKIIINQLNPIILNFMNLIMIPQQMQLNIQKEFHGCSKHLRELVDLLLQSQQIQIFQQIQII